MPEVGGGGPSSGEKADSRGRRSCAILSATQNTFECRIQEVRRPLGALTPTADRSRAATSAPSIRRGSTSSPAPRTVSVIANGGSNVPGVKGSATLKTQRDASRRRHIVLRLVQYSEEIKRGDPSCLSRQTSHPGIEAFKSRAFIDNTTRAGHYIHAAGGARPGQGGRRVIQESRERYKGWAGKSVPSHLRLRSWWVGTFRECPRALFRNPHREGAGHPNGRLRLGRDHTGASTRNDIACKGNHHERTPSVVARREDHPSST